MLYAGASCLEERNIELIEKEEKIQPGLTVDSTGRKRWDLINKWLTGLWRGIVALVDTAYLHFYGHTAILGVYDLHDQSVKGQYWLEIPGVRDLSTFDRSYET